MTYSRAGRKPQQRAQYPNRAQALRIAQGKTLVDCADAIGAKPQAISRYEISGIGLGHTFRYALARYLGVSAEEMDRPIGLEVAATTEKEIE